MHVFRPVLAGLLPLFLVAGPSHAFAQQPAPAAEAKKPTAEDRKKLREKAFQLLDETVAEIPALQIPENRILLLSNAVPLLSAQNPEKAREVATFVVAEVMRCFGDEEFAPEDPEFRRQARIRQRVFGFYSTTLLQLAEVDGEGALELFHSSWLRIEARLEDFQRINLAELKRTLEIAAIRTDPAKLAALIRKLVEKKQLDEAVRVLPFLTQKHRKEGEQVFEEVLNAVIASNFPEKDKADLFSSLANLIGAESDLSHTAPDTSANAFTVSVGTRRKLFSAFAQTAETSGTVALYSDQVTRYAPEFLPKLKKWTNEDSPFQSRDPFELLEREITSGKMPLALLEGVISLFASSSPKPAQTARFRKILESAPDPNLRAQLLKKLEATQTIEDVAAGKSTVEEFTRLVERTRSTTVRHKLLVDLAQKSLKKKNYKQAAELLEQALVNANATENPREKLTWTLAVADLFANFDPERAFDLYEPQIDRQNEIHAAMTTLGGYIDADGEIPVKGDEFNLLLLQATGEILPPVRIPPARLVRADFDRARSLVERIKSPEFRAKHRLELVQSVILTEEPNSGATANGDAPSDQKEETTPQ